jgi:AcrR family transcriptional regulator
MAICLLSGNARVFSCRSVDRPTLDEYCHVEDDCQDRSSDRTNKKVGRRPIVAHAAAAIVDTRTLILDAARSRLLADGYAGLSTRKVAEEAGVPVSQLNYHFGSKQGLILALFEEENQRRLARQIRMYALDLPLWQRYEQACDFLEDDLDSGYVRVLQELIAAGWSNAELGAAVRELLGGWVALLAEVAREAERRHGPLGPFTAEELATLVASAFFGSESLLLLGFDREVLPIRSALRRVGLLIRQLEGGRTHDAGMPAVS